MDKTEYKQTELGKIPKEWEVKTVKDLMDEDIIEKPLDGNHGAIHPKSSDYVEKGIPFIMASDLKNGKIDINNCKFITHEQAKSLKKGFAKNNDVLLSHKATMGRTALVIDLETEYIVLTPQVTYYRVQNPNKLYNKYLKLYFDSPNFQRLLLSWSQSGSTRSYLGIAKQQSLPIILPGIEEQRAIAGVLGALDDKIELNMRMNKTLEALGQAIFKHWFIDFEFPNEEGKPYKSSGGSMKHSPDLDRPIPKDWHAGSISSIVEIIGGGTPKTTNPEYWNGNIPWLSVVDFNNGSRFVFSTEKYITEDGLHNSSTKMLSEDDLIISARGTVGVVAQLGREMAFNQSNYGLKAKECINNDFLYYLLKSSIADIQMNTHGSVFSTITRNTFDSLLTVIPGESSTDEFAKIMQPVNEKMKLNELEIKTLTEIRDSLLPKLMSGKIRVDIESEN